MPKIDLGRVLIVDDEIELTTVLCEMLEKHGYEVSGFISGADAVEAMKLGAFDYILKPFKFNLLLPILSHAVEIRNLRKENLHLRETMAIYELSKAIAFTTDLNTILNKVADAVLQQCEADEMSIMLPTENKDELYVAVIRGEHRENFLGQRIPLNIGIAGWVARHNETLTLYGKITDPRFSPIEPRSGIVSSTSMPMLLGGKFIGVLNVNSKRKSSFTPGKIKALSILASTAASALENAGLYIKLSDAEKKYRLIFKNAIEGIVQFTPEGMCLTVNPAMARIFGYDSPDEFLQQEKSFHEWDFWSEYKKILETGHGLRAFEHRIFRRDGSIIWVSANIRPVLNKKGRLLFYEGTMEDITERKKFEENLIKSRDFYLALFEEFPHIIWWVDKDGKINYLNKFMQRLSGKTQKELVTGWNTIIHPDDLEKFREYAKEAIILHKSFETEIRLRRHDGNYRWILTVGKPYKDIEGNFAGYIGAGYDITRRREAEENLQESLNRFKSIMQETVNALSCTVEMRDQYTAGHQRRVADLALAIARRLKLAETQTEGIYIAGVLHDIGKIYIPSEILVKPGSLNKIEFELIKTHPQVGYEILKNIGFIWPISQIALQHHERIDGSGYPFGLSGENILIEAKILAVADVIEAMSSYRPYRPALGMEKAIEEISEKSGVLYEPKVVEACIELFQKGLLSDLTK